jgi:hypothetical protein
MVVAAAATGVLSLYGPPSFADSRADSAATDSPGVASGNNVQVPVSLPINLCGNTVDVVAALNPAFGNSCAHGSGSHESNGSKGTNESRGSHRSHGSNGSHGSHGAPRHSTHHEGRSAHGSVPSDGHSGGRGDDFGHSDRSGDAGSGSGSSAHGEAYGSPGVGSGNLAEFPVDLPVNLCGITADLIGIANPVFGNDCENGPGGYDDTPSSKPPTTPPAAPPHQPVKTPTAPPAAPEATPVVVPAGQPTLAHTGSEEVLATSAASAALLIGGAVLYRRGRVAARR